MTNNGSIEWLFCLIANNFHWLGFISQLSPLKGNVRTEQLRGLKKFYKRKDQNKEGTHFSREQ